MLETTKKDNKFSYYVLLFAVIIMWGIDPIVNTMQYENYSPLALSIISSFVSVLLFLILSLKKLKLVNKKFLALAIPIGTINTLGCLFQRIGLLLTTPINYAFLEHLSCAVVPFALFLISKKRPTFFQIFATITCLVGCTLISGILNSSVSFNFGDLLCAISGVLFGFSIPLMSSHLNNVDITLYTFFQLLLDFILSILFAIILNHIKIDGYSLEQFRFSLNFYHVLFAIGFGLLTVGCGWLMRNTANSHLNPLFISVTMPFSAIISAIVSIICKTDVFSFDLLIGGTLVTIATIISGISNAKRKK